MLIMLLPSLIEGYMRLREEQPVTLSFKGLKLNNESPFHELGWVSAPPDCLPNETCKPESMGGTMNPLGGYPPPF